MVIHNLTLQPTPFVGRDQELNEILRLLSDPTCRLLTLVAPGGMGKTRLALEVGRTIAEGQAASFSDGVYFVPLQPVNAPEFIVPAIATALHFQFYGIYEPQQQLLDYLCGQSLFLILDNFEHLQAGASFFSEMLTVAPQMRLLVTSRERLNLVEEWVVELRGLRYPDEQIVPQKDSYSAVQLFTQSARRVRVDFAVTDDNRLDVARICRQVEGMPLALELAAGWTRVLSCQQIADQLESGLDILSTTVRNVPERHRSMRSTLDQAWALLTDSEREVIKRLSVFRGGFQCEAAQVVAGATLPVLAALVDKTWLQWSEKHARYTIHELLRQYGDEQLRANDAEWEVVHNQHCHYYADFLFRQWEHLSGGRSIEALREVEGELDNIRAYWDWATSHLMLQQIEMALDSLWFFFDMGSRFHEGEQLFARAAALFRSDRNTPSHRTMLGKVLARQGSLVSSLSRYEDAGRLLQESLDILRESDVVADLAFALFRMGYTVFNLKEYSESRACFQESFDLYQTLSNRWGMGHTLHWLGITCEFMSENDKAQEFFRESLTIFEGINHAIGIASVKSQWGQLATRMADHAEARRLVHDGLVIFQEAGITWGIAMSYFRLCDVLVSGGDYEGALSYALQSLTIAAQYGLQVHKLLSLGRIARLRNFLGYFKRATEMSGFLIVHLDAEDSKRYRDLLDELKHKMLPDIFTTALERGRAYDEAVLVKEVLVEGLQHSTAVEKPLAQPLLDPLTERELEVLRLVGQGLSNREIASQLVIALGTVKRYVSDIYSKLDVSSRVQAASRARELNLH